MSNEAVHQDEFHDDSAVTREELIEAANAALAESKESDAPT